MGKGVGGTGALGEGWRGRASGDAGGTRGASGFYYSLL